MAIHRRVRARCLIVAGSQLTAIQLTHSMNTCTTLEFLPLLPVLHFIMSCLAVYLLH
jgi:hypothetical protein